MGNHNVNDKKPSLHNLETQAVELANQYKKFIAEIRDPKTDTNNLLTQYQLLKKNSLPLLNDINTDAVTHGLNEITNYYYLYFLQQISKFNHYVNQAVIIVDNRQSDQNPAVINETYARFDVLRDASINTIIHPLLNQAGNLLMTVTIGQGNIFRDTFIEDDEGTRYYYHSRTTEQGHKHQDRAHYMKANMMIGSATQKSNLSGFFKSSESSHQYFKQADKNHHKKEQQLFRSAINNIQSGEALTQDEENVLKHGKYYRYNSPITFKPVNDERITIAPETGMDYQITHIGHAAEVISLQNTIPLTICIDPVHYQSGTGGIIGAGSKILYDRYTDPAFATDGYPAINIVLISHNHFDHMCEASLKEAFGQSNTLFIVPAGDAKHLQAFGMTNVIEIGSWNDVLRINLKDNEGKSSDYEILPFPANHASCRSTSDLFASLYMGYMIRDVSKNHMILCTGDTAVLSPEHFQQLEQYLLNNSLSISTACIAHGPDRPRSWMECTHQSTADAISMHAEFNVMNARVFTKSKAINTDELTFDQLQQSACYGVGYHQGCYRLGLLSLSDVDTTLLRTLAVLESFSDTPISEITEDTLQTNVFFHFMDKFEQTSLINTLQIYQRLQVSNAFLTGKQTATLITSHLNIPQPGYRADFSKSMPYETFVFDYERLLLNKNPDLKTWDDKAFRGATEKFCHALNPQSYMSGFNKSALVARILTIYIESKTDYQTKKHGHLLISQFRDDAQDGKINDRELDARLGELYASLFPKQDEHIRNEGHCHTALTIIAGLLHFPDFRKKMQERYNQLHKTVILEEDIELNMEYFSLVS